MGICQQDFVCTFTAYQKRSLPITWLIGGMEPELLGKTKVLLEITRKPMRGRLLALLEELDDLAVLGLSRPVERRMPSVVAQQRVRTAAQ